MKKLFTLCILALIFCSVVQAQMLATFEDGADDKLIKGGWCEVDRFVVEPGIGENAAKGGLNTSDRCFLAVAVENADWWGQFGFLEFINPVMITENNRYLKFLAYRSHQAKDFRICVGNDPEKDEVFYGKLTANATWEGVVVDLGNYVGEEISCITIVYSANWSDPRQVPLSTYMFDNFELSDNTIPPGQTEVDGSTMQLNFESEQDSIDWVAEYDLIVEQNNYKIIDNPFTTSTINAGGKVVEFYKSDQASWWQGFRVVFNDGLIVRENNYLHVMVYVPSTVLQNGEYSIDVQLCTKDFILNENTEAFTVWDDEMDEWIDLVLPITEIAHLKEITVRFDIRKDGTGEDAEWINSPANTYYIDAIAFNSNENPRTIISSGLNNTQLENDITVIGGEGFIKINSKQAVAAQVFNVAGTMVKQISATDSQEISLDKGLYIVKVQTLDGNSKGFKALVK